MKNLPIPIHQLALLQSYLYEIFSYKKECKKSFKNTEWYLKVNYSKKEVTLALEFFRNNGITCDCDIINKFDLRKFTDNKFHYH